MSATILFVDNQSTVKLIKNPEFHKRTKHIDIKYHFIREKVVNQEIDVKHISSEKQLTDLDKSSSKRDRFWSLKSKLSICNVKHINGGSVKCGLYIEFIGSDLNYLMYSYIGQKFIIIYMLALQCIAP